MGQSTISMAVFHSYVCLPEGIWDVVSTTHHSTFHQLNSDSKLPFQSHENHLNVTNPYKSHHVFTHQMSPRSPRRPQSQGAAPRRWWFPSWPTRWARRGSTVCRRATCAWGPRVGGWQREQKIWVSLGILFFNWLVVTGTWLLFFIYWECHHPNWLINIFWRVETTNQLLLNVYMYRWISLLF